MILPDYQWSQTQVLFAPGRVWRCSLWPFNGFIVSALVEKCTWNGILAGSKYKGGLLQQGMFYALKTQEHLNLDYWKWVIFLLKRTERAAGFYCSFLLYSSSSARENTQETPSLSPTHCRRSSNCPKWYETKYLLKSVLFGPIRHQLRGTTSWWPPAWCQIVPQQHSRC